MFGLMISVILFIAAVQLFPVLNDQVTDVRGDDKLNCTSTELSTGAAANCVLIDWAGFYWFGIALVVVISMLTLRKLTSDS